MSQEDKKSSGPKAGGDPSQPATKDLPFLKEQLLNKWYTKLTEATKLIEATNLDSDISHYHTEFNEDLLKIKVTVENLEAVKSFFKYFQRFFNAYSKANGCYYVSTPHFICEYIMQQNFRAKCCMLCSGLNVKLTGTCPCP